MLCIADRRSTQKKDPKPKTFEAQVVVGEEQPLPTKSDAPGPKVSVVAMLFGDAAHVQ